MKPRAQGSLFAVDPDHEAPPAPKPSFETTARVAVPAPLGTALTYGVPPELAGSVRPGSRVVCELGRRRVLAVVLSTEAAGGVSRPSSETGGAPQRHALKPILALVEAEPILPEELLRFLEELSRYYFAPIGEVLRLALPAVLRTDLDQAAQSSGSALAAKHVGRAITFARATENREEPGKLRGHARAVLDYLRAVHEEPVASLETRFGAVRPALKRLAESGLVALELRTRIADPFFDEAVARDEPPELTAEQAAAALAIERALEARSPDEPSHFLLFGVTGSGKTEVYLRAIAAARAKGLGALVLVPEIALTPQLVGRFRARFGDALAVLHSGLSEADRHAMWSRLRRGEVEVAIGARSALFAPVPRLGLIVVDEEHDGSFKQEEGVRYHARDMALLRAHRAGATAVLGSATPSLESLELARSGKLRLLRLAERAKSGARLPDIETVDLRIHKTGPSGQRMLTFPLHKAIGQALEAGDQCILFLNRRGFAPSVVCDACGGTVECPACSVGLTFHRRGGGRLRCHYCDYQDTLPERCPACGAAALGLEGLGTERLEDVISAAFPTARVLRLDRDVASGPDAEAILERMRRREADVLVGTQMVTKGHDLPGVTLVGVVNADAALSQPDFRAAERGFQLLVQVAGRAGRHERPGRVLVQTRNPEHPAIVFAKRHDVEGFAKRERRDRAEVGYPPHSRLALFRVDSLDDALALGVAREVAAAARATVKGSDDTVVVRGPAPAPIARLRGRYRHRVLLRSGDRAALREVVRAVLSALGRVDGRVRLVVDIDPVSMS